MAYNNADIELLAGLNINSSEAEILRAIKILEQRIRKNSGAKITVDATLDDTALKAAVEKLQNILQGKDLSVDTKNSIKAISEEANAMLEVVSAAKKASEEKLEFAEANRKVRDSADDTVDAINREHDAMENLEDIDYILDSINMSGQHGQSVFQQFGDTLRNAFYAYTAANLLQDALHEIIDAGEEGVETVKELNDALTSLRMATGQSYESVKELLGAYNELGQELGAVTVDVSESADEWLRQGHSISDTNELIKDSLMLSKISNLESAESTKYLTSAMQGYRVAAEDVIQIVDKLSAVDLESATDAGGLAEAMSRTAEGARIAGVSMDRLLGMIATVGEVTQKSMSSIGEAYKTTFSRMRDIKDNKLSIIGDDGEIEDISNVEIVLESLGIKLRDSNLEFRNFQEVLDEVGASWDKYTTVQKAAIAKAFSGTRQQENFLVMMENWDKVLEYTEVAANSAGTAEEKFGYYLESLEAKTNSLKASLENLASVTISDELYGSVLDTTKAVVDMTAETGILKGTLAGLGTAGAIYTFQHLATYLHNATQEFANLGEAMQITRNANGTITDIQRLIDLTGGLSQSQTRLLLSTNNLTDAQKIAILMNQGLTRAEAQQQIQTWGVATAQQGATTATISFSTALRGLWTTLMANPLVLISTAVTIGVTAFNKYKQSQEEAIRATKEAAEEANELGDEISSLTTKYLQLTEAVQSDENAKEDLLSVQEDVLEAFGLEASSIDDLIKKYGSLSNAIQQISVDKLREAQIDLIAGIDVAKEDLVDANDSGFWHNKNIINATGDDSVKAFKELEKAGIITKGSYGSSGGAFVLTGDDETVEGALDNYHRLEDALEALRDSNAFTAEELSDNKLYQGLYKRYKEIKDEVEAYETAVGNLNENIIQQNTLIALQGKELPKTKEAFEKLKDGIVKSTDLGGDFMGDESAIRNTLDNYLSTLPEFKQFYLDLSDLQEDATSTGMSVDTVEFISDTQKKAITDYKNTLEQIAKIKENGSDYSGLITTFPEYDWSKYLSGAESLDMALRKIASGSFTDVKNQFEGMSEVESLLEELRRSLLESFELYDFGWTENLEHYNALVELLEQVRKGKEFTRDEITDILADYDLHGDIKALGNGFTIDENAIKTLVNRYAEAHNESLQKVRESLEEVGISPDTLLGTNSYKELLDTSKGGSTNDFSEELDWAAHSVDVLKNKVSKLETLLDNAKGWDEQKQAIENVIQAQKELKRGYEEQAKVYATEYQETLYSGILKSEGLSEQVKKAIESGDKFSIEDFIDKNVASGEEGIREQIYNAIKDAIDWYNDSTAANDNAIKLGFEIVENELEKEKIGSDSEIFDWYETLIERLQKKADEFSAVVSDTYKTWEERDEALQDQISTTGEIIEAQKKAVEAYQKALDSITLDQSYIDKIRSGAFEIEELDGSANEQLVQQISDYMNAYEKLLKLSEELAESERTLVKLRSQGFNDVQTKYNSMLADFENKANLLKNELARVEAQGQLARQSYYEKMYNNTAANIKTLVEYKKALEEELASSGMTAGEEFENTRDIIDDVALSIEQAKNELIDFENAIREIDWDIFDFTRNQEAKLMEEADFLIELLEGSDLYDELGGLTDAGLATLGLRASNYNAYLEQSIKYAEELANLEEQIKAAPDDSTLIEKYNERLELQRELILLAETERDAIISLVSEGLEVQKSALNDLIDKYLTAINSQRDLYNWQKKMANYSKNIAAIQKQLSAYSGDNSEEAKARIQKLKIQLEELEEAQEAEQWDKYLSEQREILYTLYDEYEQCLDKYIEDAVLVLEDSLERVNTSNSLINSTIQAESEKVGYEISSEMKSIWADENGILFTGFDSIKESVKNGTGVLSEFETSLKDVLTGIKNNFNDKWDTSNEITDNIETDTDALIGKSEEIGGEISDLEHTVDSVENNVESIKNAVNSIADTTKSILSKVGTTTASGNTSLNSGYNAGSDNDSTGGKNTTGNAQENHSFSQVGDMFYGATGSWYESSDGTGDVGKVTTAGATTWRLDKVNEGSAYPYHLIGLDDNNKFAGSGWVKKLPEYSTGLKKATKDHLAWTQENGEYEVIIRPSDGAILTPIKMGDSVLNSESSKRLFEFFNNPEAFTNGMGVPKVDINIPEVKIPDVNHVNNVARDTFDSTFNVTISLPNVSNYNEFARKLASDNKFELVIKDIIASSLGNGSPLQKHFRFK